LEDPAQPRRARGEGLDEAMREDLDGYAAVDLRERIAQLEAEIERTKAALNRKSSGRAAAEALFTGLN